MDHRSSNTPCVLPCHHALDGEGCENGHVHFSAEQVAEHESEIQIQPRGDGRLDVHLGFLQYKHCYQVTFSIKDRLGEDIEADPLENLHVQMEKYKPTEDGEGHDLVISFNAHREKLMEERLTLTDKADKSKTLLLVFHARVLGKGKGTPALRNGIHCTRVDWDEDSDASDWQGFN